MVAAQTPSALDGLVALDRADDRGDRRTTGGPERRPLGEHTDHEAEGRAAEAPLKRGQRHDGEAVTHRRRRARVPLDRDPHAVDRVLEHLLEGVEALDAGSERLLLFGDHGDDLPDLGVGHLIGLRHRLLQ